MTEQLWSLAGLAGASAPLAGLAAALVRNRWQRRAMPRAADAAREEGQAPWVHHLPPTIDAAEREMAMLLRRMRAYLRDRYDYTASRIADEAAFEQCLDRATLLGCQIAELGGAAPAGPAEQERMRGLILEGLTLGRGMTGRAAPPRLQGASRPGP